MSTVIIVVMVLIVITLGVLYVLAEFFPTKSEQTAGGWSACDNGIQFRVNEYSAGQTDELKKADFFQSASCSKNIYAPYTFEACAEQKIKGERTLQVKGVNKDPAAIKEVLSIVVPCGDDDFYTKNVKTSTALSMTVDDNPVTTGTTGTTTVTTTSTTGTTTSTTSTLTVYSFSPTGDEKQIYCENDDVGTDAEKAERFHAQSLGKFEYKSDAKKTWMRGFTPVDKKLLTLNCPSGTWFQFVLMKISYNTATPPDFVSATQSFDGDEFYVEHDTTNVVLSVLGGFKDTHGYSRLNAFLQNAWHYCENTSITDKTTFEVLLKPITVPDSTDSTADETLKTPSVTKTKGHLITSYTAAGQKGTAHVAYEGDVITLRSWGNDLFESFDLNFAAHVSFATRESGFGVMSHETLSSGKHSKAELHKMLTDNDAFVLGDVKATTILASPEVFVKFTIAS